MNLTKKISGTSVDFEFEFGGEIYWANCDVSYHVDPDFGADADGNRGTTRRFIEDVEILRVETVDGLTVEPDEKMVEFIKEEAGERL